MEEEKQKQQHSRRRERKRVKRLTDTTLRHLEHLTKQARALAGEDISEPQEISETFAKANELQQKHAEYFESLSRREKLIASRLRQEFEEAQAEGTSVCEVEGEAWNDVIIAVFHQLQDNVKMNPQQGLNDVCSDLIRSRHGLRTIYKAAGKTIYGLKGGRVGIQLSTYFMGQPMECYYCVLSSDSFPEKMHVNEHTVPFFLALHEPVKSYLSSSPTKFIESIADYLQGFVSRREQIYLFKRLEKVQLKRFHSSLPHTSIDLSLLFDEPKCIVTISLSYNFISELPAQSKVLVWPLAFSGNVTKLHSSSAPSQHLPGAENAMKTKMLHEAYADIVTELNSLFGDSSSLRTGL